MTHAIICPLAQHLIHQIAAGEVVENPASVAKELIENSLDAQAKSIEIHADGGGIQRLMVRDNGHGIAADQLILAVANHATSKVHSSDDLQQITSYGFRGEALASLGAVARLRVCSNTGGEHGWQISNHQNQQDFAVPPMPASHPVGTTVEMRELFFNVTPRRKFLKKPAWEMRQIQEVVRRFGLIRWDCEWRFYQDGQPRLHWPAVTDHQREQRLLAVLGEEFARHALYFEHRLHQGGSLYGWASDAGYSRSQADCQYVFVNQRWIHNRQISQVIHRAYQPILPANHHGAVVLFLQLDPKRIDVNAHPAKREIRFDDPLPLFEQIRRTLHKTLAVKSTQTKLPQPTKPPTKIILSLAEAKPSLKDSLYQGETKGERLSGISSAQGIIKPKSSSTIAPFGQALAHVYQQFMLAHNQQKLFLIDLPKAYQALTYQQLKQSWRLHGRLTSQALLLPISLPLSAHMMGVLQAHEASLQRLGLQVGQLSPKKIVIRSIPALLASGEWDYQALLRETLSQLAAMSDLNHEPALTKILRVIAHHQTLPLDKPLTLSQMNQLLRQLEVLPCHQQANWWVEISRQALTSLLPHGD